MTCRKVYMNMSNSISLFLHLQKKKKMRKEFLQQNQVQTVLVDIMQELAYP